MLDTRWRYFVRTQWELSATAELNVKKPKLQILPTKVTKYWAISLGDNTITLNRDYKNI